MTKTNEQLAALIETRIEIGRINRAAGETVFNPAATSALQAVIDALLAEAGFANIDDYLAAERAEHQRMINDRIEPKAATTANENAVLKAILRNYFTSINGGDPANYQEASDWVLSDCINDSDFPSGITSRALAGVCGSLATKGLVETNGSGREACIRLTVAGYEIAKAL